MSCVVLINHQSEAYIGVYVLSYQHRKCLFLLSKLSLKFITQFKEEFCTKEIIPTEFQVTYEQYKIVLIGSQ